MGVCLVLEGGAMRGLFTAGVLDVFLSEGVRVDCVVGVSAGALFGVNYVSGQAGRALRYCSRYNGDKNYMGLRPLLREGNLFSTSYAYEEVPRRLDPFDDAAYQRAKIPFYAVVTEIMTGEPDYLRIDSVFDQMDVLRASGSMPFVSRPVRLGNQFYLDGGISDSIPVRWAMGLGHEKTIVVLTREASYRKKPASPLLSRLCARRQPGIARKMQERHRMYNREVEEIEQLEQEGRLFVIRPPQPLEIRRTETDPQRMRAIHAQGCGVCRERMEALREYLK